MVYGGAASSFATAATLRHRLAPQRRHQFVCHVCWEIGSGSLLHCPSCKLDVHISCCSSAHLSETTHFSHSRHPLLPLPAIRNADRRCDGCAATAADGPLQFFSCVPCSFDLCSLCVRSPRYLRHPSHPHILTLGKSSRRSSCLCNGCGQPANDHILMYRCNACDFDLHQACVRLPLHSSAEIKGHEGHSLSLRGVVAGSARSGGGAICSSCGEEAGGSGSWAYACNTCKRGRPFFIHPRCAALEHRGGVFATDDSNAMAITTSHHNGQDLDYHHHYLVEDTAPQSHYPRYRFMHSRSEGSYGAARERLNAERFPYIEDGGGGGRNGNGGFEVEEDVERVRGACLRLRDASDLSGGDEDAVDRVLALLGDASRYR